MSSTVSILGIGSLKFYYGYVRGCSCMHARMHARQLTAQVGRATPPGRMHPPLRNDEIPEV
eukprot:6197808-Pleurochrysis_carterae.AAC.3